MRITKILLALGTLFACSSPKNTASTIEPGKQWDTFLVPGAATFPLVCPASFTCEEQITTFFPNILPFQGGTILRKNNEDKTESSMLAISYRGLWFAIEGENPQPKEKDKTSRIKYEFTSLQSKPIQLQHALLIQGTRREEVFCDTCANPLAKTVPSLVYESEFLKICIANKKHKIVCTDTIDSEHNQDGPTKLSFEVKGDLIQLNSPAGRFTKEKRAPLEAGTYQVMINE
jgi:hypothetical protein